MNCSLLPNNTGTFTCPDCGLTLPTDKVKANCKAKMPKGSINTGIQTPDLSTRLTNFTKAVVEHVRNGNQVVSQDVMRSRLAICRECPLFKTKMNEVGGICTHESCGCTIQDNLNYLNKIAWADQKCPIDKWDKEGV
jgi:hypothetical protein